MKKPWWGIAWRLEHSHDLFPFPGRTMRIFNPVVQAFMSPMIRIGCKGSNLLDVVTQFVRYHDPWLAELCDQFTEETPGCLRVAAR